MWYNNPTKLVHSLDVNSGDLAAAAAAAAELGIVTNGMFVSPPRLQVEIHPNEDGAFGKWVGREGGVSLGLVCAHSGPSEDSEMVAVIDKTQIWPSSGPHLGLGGSRSHCPEMHA